MLTGRRTEVLEPLAAELGARALAVDLADRRVDRLIDEVGDVDVLVANAALPASGRSWTSREQIDRALEVNLRAPMVLARVLASGWRRAGGATSCSISSLSGKSGAGPRVYSATKFGLRGFGQGLREDLHARGRGERRLPRLHPRRGDVPRPGAKLPGRRHERRPSGRGRVVDAIERDRGEVDVAPLRCGSARGSRRSRRRCRRGSSAWAGRRSLRARRRSGRQALAPVRAASPVSWLAAGGARPVSAATASSTSLASRGPSRALGRRLDAHDDLVAVELLEHDRAAAAHRRLDGLVEQLLDLERRHAGGQTGAQVDAVGLAQRHDGDVEHDELGTMTWSSPSAKVV